MKPTSSKIKFEPQTLLCYILAKDSLLLIICHSLPNTHCRPHPSLEWSSFSSSDIIKFGLLFILQNLRPCSGLANAPTCPSFLFLLRWDLINLPKIVLNLLYSPGKPWISDPAILAAWVVGIKGLHHQIKSQHFVWNPNLIGIVEKRQKIKPIVNSSATGETGHHLGATKASYGMPSP